LLVIAVFIPSVTVLSSAGHTNSSAPVSPVDVPAVTCAGVDFSTLPATVVLALGVVAHGPLSCQAPLIYVCSTHSVVLIILSPTTGVKASLCTVVRDFTVNPAVSVPENDTFF
jgi:hypothetical protein